MLAAMQVSSSLIAAQAAAREAQARFQAQIRAQAQPQGTPAVQANSAPAAADGFSALPLKQVQAPAQPPAAPVRPQAMARLGQHIDITV
jgi:hypothetical protein